MTVKVSEFINKLDGLLLGAEGSIDAGLSKLSPNEKVTDPKKISQITQSAFQECAKFIEEREGRILKDIQATDLSKETSALEKEANDIITFVRTIHKITDSATYFSFRYLYDIEISKIDEMKLKIETVVQTRAALKSLLETDGDFKKRWHSLQPKEQQVILERFEKCFVSLSDDSSEKQAIVKVALKAMLDLASFTEAEEMVSRFIRAASRKGFSVTAPIFQQYMESLFRVKKESQVEFLSNIRHYWIDFEYAEATLPGVIAISKLSNPDPKLMREYYDLSIFYGNEPEALIRFDNLVKSNKNGLRELRTNLQAYYPHAGPNAGKNLGDIMEKLGPDAMISLNNLFKFTNKNTTYYRNFFTPTNAHKLGNFFAWINEQITTNPSPENKKKLNDVMDRMIALFLDSPTMADSLLDIPKQSFPHLFILLNRDDILNITPESVREVLTKEGDVKLASHLFDKSLQIEAKIKELNVQTPTLETTLNTWLDTVLKLLKIPNASRNLSDKIKALPSQYQGILNQMMKISEDNGKVLMALLNLGIKVPFSQILTKFLENMVNFLSEKPQYKKREDYLIEVIEIALDFFTSFPDATPQILSIKLEEFTVIHHLFKDDKELCGLLLKRHPKFLEDNINNDPILNNKLVQKGLRQFLQIELEHNISFIEMFNKNLIRASSVTLHHYIRHNPDIGLKIAHVLKNAPQGFKFDDTPIPYDLGIISEGLKKYPHQTQVIFNVLSKYPVLCMKEMKQLHANSGEMPPFMNLGSSGDVRKVAFLMANGETQLAEQIMKIYSENMAEAHIILDTAYALYFSEAKEMIHRIHDEGPLRNEIFDLAGKGKYGLLSKVLKLDPKKDQVLIEILLEEEESSLFENLMSLKARGDNDLVEEILKIKSNTSKKEAYMEAALEAVTKGHFLQARELLSKKAPQATLKTHMSDDEINSILEIDLKQSRNQIVTKFSIGLANCLITPSGTINTELIPQLLKSPALKQLHGLPYEGPYFTRILEYLKHPYFYERLQLQKDVPFPSRQHSIIANMLNLPENKPIDARNARVAILSTLLWPLRQSNSGSCFGTSIAINNASTLDGIKQMLEDMMSLVTYGSIVRHVSTPNNGVMEYPLVFGTQASTANFAVDNLLARTYEFTLASMAAGTTDLKRTLMEFWENHLTLKMENEFPLAKGLQRRHVKYEPLYQTMVTELRQQLSKSCTLVFNGYAQHPIENRVGAWLILDSETGERLDADGAALKFYTRVFAATRDSLSKQFPTESELFKSIFDKVLLPYVQSDEFSEDFYEMPNQKPKGLVLVNPVKYFHHRVVSPFTQFVGGFSHDLFKNFHGATPITLKHVPTRNPFATIAETLQLLSDADFNKIKSSPAKLFTAQTADHAFNFRLEEAANLLVNKKADELWESHKKALHAIESTPLTKEMTDAILKAFLKANNKEIHSQLEQDFEPQIKQCKTIRNLIDVLRETYHKVTGSENPEKDIDDAVESAIRALPECKGKFPKIYPIYDLNWSGVEQFGFGLSLFDHKLKRIYPKSGDQNYVVKWNPGDPSTIEHIKIRDNSNDFARHYFH